MIKKYSILFLVLLFQTAFGQTFEMFNNDTINKTDVEGKRQGFWIIRNSMKKLPNYRDDQKVEEGKYVDSKKTGKWKEYYPNDKPKNVITFENNRPNGYAIMYHENGKISEEGMWKNNRWVGEYKLYYENGQVQQSFKFNATGKREGDQVYFYPDGKVMITGNWQDGKENGTVTEYYANGDVKAEKVFNGGSIDIAATKTYEPKQPIVEEPVKQVVTPPVVVEVTEKPNIPKQIFNGEGQWTLYNKNKQISKDGVFHANRMIDGKVYFYSPDGILTRIAVYKDGSYIGDAVIEDK